MMKILNITAQTHRQAFSLLEVVIAVAILAVLMVSVMEALSGTAAVSGDVKLRSDLRKEAQTIVMKLSEKLADADILQYNINISEDAGGVIDTGFSFIEYQETLTLFPEVTKADPVEVSFAALQAQYPRLADNYNQVSNELNMIPDDVTGLDKAALPGFFCVVDTGLQVVYLGATIEETVNGIDYSQSHMVFIKYNGDLTEH